MFVCVIGIKVCFYLVISVYQSYNPFKCLNLKFSGGSKGGGGGGGTIFDLNLVGRKNLEGTLGDALSLKSANMTRG